MDFRRRVSSLGSRVWRTEADDPFAVLGVTELDIPGLIRDLLLIFSRTLTVNVVFVSDQRALVIEPAADILERVC